MGVPNIEKPNQSSKGGPSDAGKVPTMKAEKAPKKPDLLAKRP